MAAAVVVVAAAAVDDDDLLLSNLGLLTVKFDFTIVTCKPMTP